MSASAPTDDERLLTRRLASLSALRLGLLIALLALASTLYFGANFDSQGASFRVLLATLVAAFGSAAVVAILLLRRTLLVPVAYAQLVLDAATWTVVAWLSGGTSSGATSFLGLTVVSGAIALGARGAVFGAVTSATALATLTALLVRGTIRPPSDLPSYPTSWAALSYPLTLNLLVLVVVAILAGYLAERLRRAGGALQVANQRADEAERLAVLGRFAAGLAHEIRNPLGAIAGSVQLLAEAPGLGEEEKLLCGIISREAARLNDLVTDMLEVSRPRRPEKTQVDLAALAREVVQLQTASGRGAEVRVRCDGDGPLPILADGAQLRQVTWNLVRNAIQASGAGAEVTVTTARLPDGRATLEVKDDGPGIPDSARPRLFDAFFTTRSHGVGIGLALVKRIVDDHGFSIEVDSDEGEGATFRVIVPAEAIETA